VPFIENVCLLILDLFYLLYLYLFLFLVCFYIIIITFMPILFYVYNTSQAYNIINASFPHTIF
jgi:hypothetical protein